MKKQNKTVRPDTWKKNKRNLIRIVVLGERIIDTERRVNRALAVMCVLCLLLIFAGLIVDESWSYYAIYSRTLSGALWATSSAAITSCFYGRHVYKVQQDSKKDKPLDDYYYGFTEDDIEEQLDEYVRDQERKSTKN